MIRQATIAAIASMIKIINNGSSSTARSPVAGVSDWADAPKAVTAVRQHNATKEENILFTDRHILSSVSAHADTIIITRIQLLQSSLSTKMNQSAVFITAAGGGAALLFIIILLFMKNNRFVNNYEKYQESGCQSISAIVKTGQF